MNLLETVKYGVSNREAADYYGVEVNHNGMALCPFHIVATSFISFVSVHARKLTHSVAAPLPTKSATLREPFCHPNLLVADDHYHCFACGEHGDVIDFVAKLFDLSLYDAARKLAADFHLSPDKPPNAAALNNRRKNTQAQQLRKKERLCFSDLTDYLWILRDWKVRYAPRSPDEEQINARFIEACYELDHVEYLLDEFMAGDSQERAELVDSNSVRKIQSHLAQIKEECAIA